MKPGRSEGDARSAGSPAPGRRQAARSLRGSAGGKRRRATGNAGRRAKRRTRRSRILSAEGGAVGPSAIAGALELRRMAEHERGIVIRMG